MDKNKKQKKKPQKTNNETSNFDENAYILLLRRKIGTTTVENNF